MKNNNISRNPYFIGILSAILPLQAEEIHHCKSQSLFYWNPFCNELKSKKPKKPAKMSQSLFYWNPFCNLKVVYRYNEVT